MTSTLIVEFNTTLAQAHLAAIRVLHRLLESEKDPHELRRLAALLTRVKPMPDGGAPPRNPRLGRPGKAADQAPGSAETPDQPAATASDPSTPHAASLLDDRAQILHPLRTPRPASAPSPITLMQAAACATSLHALTGAT